MARRCFREPGKSLGPAGDLEMPSLCVCSRGQPLEALLCAIRSSLCSSSRVSIWDCSRAASSPELSSPPCPSVDTKGTAHHRQRLSRVNLFSLKSHVKPPIQPKCQTKIKTSETPVTEVCSSQPGVASGDAPRQHRRMLPRLRSSHVPGRGGRAASPSLQRCRQTAGQDRRAPLHRPVTRTRAVR